MKLYCGKQIYLEVKFAQDMARVLSRFGVQSRAYLCPTCRHWHVVKGVIE